MEEIVKHINDTNASFRTLGAGDAKNTDLFLDNEHYELFRDAGEHITVRFNKENLQKAILFIASILPRKYDNSSIHKVEPFSSAFVFDQLALLDAFFTIDGNAVEIRTQSWNARKDVEKKNGEIDNRFYFNGLLEEVSYKDYSGVDKSAKFTIRNYLAGGYSDLHIKKADDGVFDIWITNALEPKDDGKERAYEVIAPQSNSEQSQIIYYGCPGSGKSHEVRKKTNTAHNEGFAGLSSIERQQAYQKYLDDKNGHKKNYKGGKVNIIALTHPKLMSYIALCSEYEINSLFEISNEEDFNAIIEALKGCEAYQNDSITKGSGCHWETGLKSYGEFLKDQIPNTEPRKDAVFRTTFHPDTDYAAFVGCYKPCMNGGVIEYSYMPQVFTNAYIAAWENTKKPVYLVIEEINRGNCAQIFGDLFQLLDRDKVTGKSEYPIKADKDLVAHIEKVLGAGHEGIKNGELCLPSNLIIYATMNTSDQSLFPMDSAFKRRWDWEYVPINYSKDIDSGKFTIKLDDNTEYLWVDFLKKVNDKIYDATNSEDKQMGNFFIKKSIKANEFVNKVMFYLWNEVCKEEYGTQRNFFRKGKEGKTEFKFTELFGDNQATILKEFMTSLGVEPIGKKTEEPAAE